MAWRLTCGRSLSETKTTKISKLPCSVQKEWIKSIHKLFIKENNSWGYLLWHHRHLAPDTNEVNSGHDGSHYCSCPNLQMLPHDDVITWKHLSLDWPFVRGTHRSPVNSPNKGQWRGAFDVFFDLRVNKQLNKQSWGWWFETLSRPLWRQCNDWHNRAWHRFN